MYYSKDSDSDNNEGYVIKILQIKQKERPNIVVISTLQPTDYQPRYINVNTLISYVQIQTRNKSGSHPSLSQLIAANQSLIFYTRKREIVPKIYKPNFSNKNYQLVYQNSDKKQPEPMSTGKKYIIQSAIHIFPVL